MTATYTLGGTKVGEGTTDSEGYYSLELDSIDSQPLKLVASGGYYTEEFSNKTVLLVSEDKLYVMVNYT